MLTNDPLRSADGRPEATTRRRLASWAQAPCFEHEALMKETSVSTERKVAVITGASQGMGAALVDAYRDHGYGVVATARSTRPNNDDQILVVPGDITDRKTAQRAISEGLTRFGRIHTLINNAGVFVAKPFTQYTEADCAERLRDYVFESVEAAAVGGARSCCTGPASRLGAVAECWRTSC